MEQQYGLRDFKHCEESLYRTTKGAWFLVGEGGPMSKYAEPVSGGMIGGSALTPLSDREAQRWLEDRQAHADVITAHFTVEAA